MGFAIVIEDLIVTLLSPLGTITTMAGADHALDPRMTYFEVSDNEHPHLDGDGPRQYRMQIDVWGSSKKTTRLLAESARVALRAGARVGEIVGGPGKFDDLTKFYSTNFDILVWYP